MRLHSRLPVRGVLGLAVACLISADAAAQTAGSSFEHRVLATNKTSTMEKELNEAAESRQQHARLRRPTQRDRPAERFRYFWSIEAQLIITVSGVTAGVFRSLALTRNRCPSLVTAYMLLVLITPAGKSVFGNPAAKVSLASIDADVIAPFASI